jgi:hypothetical protein
LIPHLFHLANIFHMQTPFDPLHGDGYNFWSGPGSDFGEATIIIAILAWWKHRNCQVKGCWRINLTHPTDAGHYVCKRHHPAHESDSLSADYVQAAHEAARDKSLTRHEAREFAKGQASADASPA